MVPSDFASRLKYTARLTVFMLFVAVNQHLFRSRGHNLNPFPNTLLFVLFLINYFLYDYSLEMISER